jgi:hypothetical protein
MNNEEFVNAIRTAVEQSTINSLIKEFEESKLPSEEFKKMSAFYNTLNESGKDVVKQIMIESVQSAIFGFFCVIDGVRAIEKGPGKGRLELWYKKESSHESLMLNSPDSEFLHDIYNT